MGKKASKIDICNNNKDSTLADITNGPTTLYVVDSSSFELYDYEVMVADDSIYPLGDDETELIEGLEAIEDTAYLD